MIFVKSALETQSKRSIAISFVTKNNTTLIVSEKCPANADFGKVNLDADQSAAGSAYKSGKAVYVPSTRHRLLIDIGNKNYETKGFQFQIGDGIVPFKSLLCVPVLANPDKKAVGVLNFTCNKRSAFSPLDFDIGRLAAALWSLIP